MRESDVRRPLALLVTRNFPPLLGGMEKVNQQLLVALSRAWRTALCGPMGCVDYAPAETMVVQSRLKPLVAFLVTSLWHTVFLAARSKPEWVIAGSGLTAPIAWLAARCVGGRSAVYLHGLDVTAPSRLYQWLWLPFIRRCDLVLVNSRGTCELAAKNGVPRTTTHVLNPGTDLPALDAAAALHFREQYGLGQRPLLLSVGRLTRRKGLVEFIQQALPSIVAKRPEVLLLIIGADANDALHGRGGSERARILAAARENGTEQNVRMLGRCDEASLGAAYQAANLHVFPVLNLPGDVEGFGMVALEAAAHGLASVAFNVGGVADAVIAGRTGVLVEAGDYRAMSSAIICGLATAPDSANAAACREFAQTKTWLVFADRLRALLGTAHERW